MLGRAGALLASLLGVIVLVQLLLAMAPGSAADLMAVDPEQRQALAVAWGEQGGTLTRALGGTWRTLTGDLGVSRVIRPGTPVIDMVFRPGLASGARLMAALGLGLMWAVLAGQGRRRRRLTRWLSAAPDWLLAFGLVAAINALTWALVQRGWLSRPAWFALPDAPSAAREVLAVGVLAVASGSASDLTRELKAARDAVERSPYLEAARARGAPLLPHRLRNLLPPVGRALAARAMLLAGGLVIVEKVLMLHGAGSLMWSAALQRDLPLAVGLAVVAAAGLGLLRLGLDLLVLWADPRLRGPE